MERASPSPFTSAQWTKVRCVSSSEMRRTLSASDRFQPSGSGGRAERSHPCRMDHAFDAPSSSTEKTDSVKSSKNTANSDAPPSQKLTATTCRSLPTRRRHSSEKSVVSQTLRQMHQSRLIHAVPHRRTPWSWVTRSSVLHEKEKHRRPVRPTVSSVACSMTARRFPLAPLAWERVCRPSSEPVVHALTAEDAWRRD